MKQNRFTTLKNMVWVAGIFICFLFIFVGLIFAMFRRYTPPEQGFDYTLYAPAQSNTADLTSSALGSGNARGPLQLLGETADGGDSYTSSITFLVDSTYIGLRDLGLVDSNKVWGSPTGSLKMDTLNSAVIRYPNDGSEISPVSAAMISKPEAASPDTRIICCGLPGVIAGYNGSDGLSVGVISDGNDWVQLVCRDTGAYFLNTQEAVSESVQLLNRYASSNGKTLNRAGLETFMRYVRTHALPRA